MLPSPLQEIFPPFPSLTRLFLKRDDLLHPVVQGNKWRKLAPVIEKMGARKQGILSFGGAFSNHLQALAAAGATFDFPTMGIVRGLAADLNNPTLLEARHHGMRLFPVSKQDYERLKKLDLEAVCSFIGYHPSEPFLVLPEGGDTPDALVGCQAIAVEISEQLPADAGQPRYFCVPAGTGCTAAGVIAGAGQSATTLVFPAAPYGVDRESILARLTAAGLGQDPLFEVVEGMRPRKFAQMNGELSGFIQSFEAQTGVLLDPVYTSKMMLRLYELLTQHFFPSGSCVVAILTGGLQGWRGMALKNPLKSDIYA